MPKKKPDAITKKWTLNKADELAVARGCFMDESKGKFVINWIEEYCHLYEDVQRDENGMLPKMKLMKWQKEFIMRAFGWQKWSKDHKQNIRRFRKLSLWVPKKNGKSPLLAAIGLYMLLAENINGQKCYSVARDKEQAMIQQRHAIAMVGASPLMDMETLKALGNTNCPSLCEINKTTGRISNPHSQSFYTVLAGSEAEHLQGLNAGFIGCDETAVVDSRTMAALEYASAKRMEPIQMEVSTAGNNNEGYGKRQFDYGRAVNLDAQHDDQFLHVEYSVDDNITEAEFAADFKNQISKCNPSLGTTVYLGELTTSFERAQGSLSKLADFLMYRANRWQNSVNPWLPVADWQICAKPDMLTARALCNHEKNSRWPRKKQLALGALDMAKVHDMCAFGLALPIDDAHIKLLVWMWLAKKYADANSFLLPNGGFTKWGQDGHLKLVDADKIDHELVARDVRKICRPFNVEHITADQMYAETAMQLIIQGVHDNNGVCVSEGVGCDYSWFPQTNASYAKPTDDFEGYVRNHVLIHGNNPCLNWQASHCEVATDSFDNKRPVKPRGKKGEDIQHKKIDGIIVSVMACALATRHLDSLKQGAPGVFFV